LEQVRVLAEADEATSSEWIEPGELEEDDGSLGDRWGRVGGEGLESGPVLWRDVGLVKEMLDLAKDLQFLADSAREAGAFLADADPMSLAAEALVGADPLADVAEATHRRGGYSGFQIQV